MARTDNFSLNILIILLQYYLYDKELIISVYLFNNNFEY